MFPGMEMLACNDLAVPREVMQHVVRVESAFNPYAIGVVGGRLARQPRNLAEAVSTTRMLEKAGYNFSLGLAQVNRYNLKPQGLDSYEAAFAVCPNLQAGSRILAECYGRSGNDWGKAFSCYYSGNFTTGFRHGYVQKVFASWRQASGDVAAAPIAVIDRRRGASGSPAPPVTPLHGVRQTDQPSTPSLITRRIEEAARTASDPLPQAPASAIAAADVVPAPVVVGEARQADVAATDAPVLVQLVGAAAGREDSEAVPLPRTASATDAVDGTPAPVRDSAFVF